MNFWPTWGPFGGPVQDGKAPRPYGDLARYVSVEAIERTPQLTVSRSPTSSVSAEADRQLAADLYRRLATIGLGYALDPRVPRGLGRQQIRDPRWLLDANWGTCLDLAVTFAAMCSAVGLDPLLVVGHGHALVAIAPGWERESRAAMRVSSFESARFPGCTEEEPGVQRIVDPDRLTGPSGYSLLAIECTGAATQSDAMNGQVSAPSSFEDAVAAGARELLRPGMRIVDIAWLQATGVHPLEPPTTDLSLRLHLPGALTQGEFGNSQQALLNRLKNATGVHVIVGKPGYGKSTIARRLVAESRFGAGWFLGASDSRVLTNSLAEAELSQQNESGVGLSDIDRAGYAESALGRLREARHDWLVVLDNADADPDSMLRRLPAPSLRGQAIVVTTTNADWAATCGFPTHNLERLTEDEVINELGNPSLVPYVAGRWLMVNAFRRLAEALEISTSEIEIPPDDDSAGKDGPGVYWLICRSRALSGDEVRAAFCGAFLPPDNVLLEAIDAVSAAASERLIEVGLLEHAEGEDSGRIHRLFRAAIQADLESEPAEAREIALLLAGTPAACGNLAEYGNRELVDRILKLIEERDAESTPPDPELGRGLHAIGSVLELRNHTKRSSESFDRARKHLDSSDPAEQLLLAECLLGMARPVNQHAKDPSELREGLAWADEAYQLVIDAGAEQRSGRFLAMRGLLRQKLAERAELNEESTRELREALAMVEEANRLRQADPQARPEELSRSEFNLARGRILLAKREPAKAAEYLDGAEATYRSVLDQRRRFYPHLDSHGHIAACIGGLAIVDYCRAVYLDVTRSQQVVLLRAATANALETLRQRELLSGPDDNDDVSKSNRLLAKIAMARHLAPHDADDARTNHDALVREVSEELVDGGFLAPAALSHE
jgi:hypothetical protein